MAGGGERTPGVTKTKQFEVWAYSRKDCRRRLNKWINLYLRKLRDPPFRYLTAPVFVQEGNLWKGYAQIEW